MNTTSFMSPDTQSLLIIVTSCMSVISLGILSVASCAYTDTMRAVESIHKKVTQIREHVRRDSYRGQSLSREPPLQEGSA